MGTLSAESMIDPSKALQKPLTEKPGAIYPANHNKNAFITNVNNPNVKKLIGSVINSRIGFKKEFINPIKIVTNNAVTKLLTVIPGISQAMKTIATEYNNHLTIKFIIYSLSFQVNYALEQKQINELVFYRLIYIKI